jgi:hypothetical protein
MMNAIGCQFGQPVQSGVKTMRVMTLVPQPARQSPVLQESQAWSWLRTI